MKFYFDTCIAIGLVEALKALEREHELIHQSMTELKADAKDEIWMQWAASREMVAITVDNKIRRRPAEWAVRQKCGLRSIFLFGAFASFDKWEQARFLVGAWSKIVQSARRQKPGECLLVGRSGKIETLRKL